MWWVVVAVVVAVLGYFWLLARQNKYWLEKGVNQGRYMTVFGDSWKIIVRKQSFAEMVLEVYNKFPNSRQDFFLLTLRQLLHLRLCKYFLLTNGIFKFLKFSETRLVPITPILPQLPVSCLQEYIFNYKAISPIIRYFNRPFRFWVIFL
jgi:hypothetical protein